MPTEISGSTGVNKIQDGTVVAGDLAASVGLGKVLQVVEGTLRSSTTSTTNYSSFVDTTNTVTITPSSTSSKILLLSVANVQSYNSGNTQNGLHNSGYTQMYRGSVSTLLGSDQLYGEANTPLNTNTYMYFSMTDTHLDSPNTTSATTYGIAFKVGDQYSGTHSIRQGTHITAIEIGA